MELKWSKQFLNPLPHGNKALENIVGKGEKLVTSIFSHNASYPIKDRKYHLSCDELNCFVISKYVWFGSVQYFIV